MQNLLNSVSIVLPSYNEELNIKEAITRIINTLGSNLLEIIIIDDNSSDNTRKIIKDLNVNKIKLIHRTKEKGLASAISRGVNESKGKIIGWLDCDLGIPPEELNKLLIFINDFDIVIGSRFVNQGKDTRKKWISFSSFIINSLCQMILDPRVRDYTSGFICLNRNVLRDIKINPIGFGEYFIELMYLSLKNKYSIKEVGYIYGDRKGGVSKSSGNVIKFYILGLSYIKKIFLLKLKY